MTGERRVTSSDVARLSGLSRATVSYVLNNDFRRIPPATRQRVLDAAAQLGYKPFGPARLLRGGRSRIVLMLTPGLETAADPGAANIITSLGAELAKADLHLVWQMGIAGTDGASGDLAPSVVLVSPTEEEAAFTDLAAQFNVPVLPAFPGLSSYLAAAATAQVEFLAGHGHRKLAYVAPATPDLSPSAEIRWTAIEQAAHVHGLDPVARVVMAVEPDLAREQLREFLDREPDVTAVCAYNDMIGFAVLAAAHGLDVTIPDRLSVIGVDDHPLSYLAVPALTSVTSDLGDFVKQMAEKVTQVAAGEAGDTVTLPLHPRVVERDSTTRRAGSSTT